MTDKNPNDHEHYHGCVGPDLIYSNTTAGYVCLNCDSYHSTYKRPRQKTVISGTKLTTKEYAQIIVLAFAGATGCAALAMGVTHLAFDSMMLTQFVGLTIGVPLVPLITVLLTNQLKEQER